MKNSTIFIFVCGFISIAHASESCEAKKNSTTSDRSHIASYIGAHAYSSDFEFQEAMRRYDLALKKLAEASWPKEKAQTFFINGWGQLFGAVLALEKHKLSTEFDKVFKENLDRAFKQDLQTPITFKEGKLEARSQWDANIREYTKNIMTYPHQGKYLDFKPVDLQEPVVHLNRYLQEESDLQFDVHEGKCYLKVKLKGDKTIFERLWGSTDFSKQLQAKGYQDMQPNNECPHITLVNSNVVSKIKEEFAKKHGTEGDAKFAAFMQAFLGKHNVTINATKDTVKFTELSATYSEDYTPFEEVVVARLKSPVVSQTLKELAQGIKSELGIDIAIKEPSSLHVTIATKYRKPAELPYKNMDDFMKADLKV